MPPPDISLRRETHPKSPLCKGRCRRRRRRGCQIPRQSPSLGLRRASPLYTRGPLMPLSDVFSPPRKEASMFHTNTKNGLTILTADTLSGVCHGFSTRPGGVSPAPWDSLNLGVGRGDEIARVQENYRRFCAALGTDVNRVSGYKLPLHLDVQPGISLLHPTYQPAYISDFLNGSLYLPELYAS